MKVSGTPYRTIWLHPTNSKCVQIIDQRALPHRFIIEDLRTVQETAVAIKDMHVRGAPLIGATAAWGMYLACLEVGDSRSALDELRAHGDYLKKTRPTAVNLAWAVDRMLQVLENTPDRIALARQEAEMICDEEVRFSRMIGEHGLSLIKEIAARKPGKTVNILTHCNAGWLACVDYGTATAPFYAAHHAGLNIHVWVDETRPRNQGASLTAWELGQEGVPHSVIADNTGGHLMQHGMVDLVITGTDRTTRTGDVANKIGTYLKALAAHDNGIPFYVALTSSAFDWKIRDGLREIPIETRTPDEVRKIQGLCEDGQIREVLLTPEKSSAVNYGFDVTPARLVTGLITERGVCRADESDILRLFPENK